MQMAVIVLGGVIIAVVTAFFSGTLYGAARQKRKDAEDRAAAMQARKDISDEVYGLGDPALATRLGRWVSK